MSSAPMALSRDGIKSEGIDGDVVVTSSPSPSEQDQVHIPLRLKIIAVLLVSAIGFGAHWSSGVTGAMKSTLKKVA